MNNDRDPSAMAGSGPIGGGRDDDPWIIVDDLDYLDDVAEAPADTAVPDTGPVRTSGAAAAGQPPVSPGGDAPGWNSFAATDTWNGMPVTPPGGTSGTRPDGRTGTRPGARTGARPGARSAPTGPKPGTGGASAASGDTASDGWAGAASRASGSDSASGWGVSADDTGGAGPGDTTEGGWFVDDGDHLDETGLDDAGGETRIGFPAGQALIDRLPRPALGPGLVTLVVTFAGILLVISSILWHPHGP